MRALDDPGRWAPLIDGRASTDLGRAVDRQTAPWDGRFLAEVEQSSRVDLERALDVAGSAWWSHRRAPAHERAAWLQRAADGLEAASETLVTSIVDLIGKPAAAARFEVGRGVQILRFAAEELARFHGENLALDGVPGGEERWGITRREPIGVVAAITPFNAPVNLLLQKVGPGLACGNALVVKPAPEAAVVALQVAETMSASLPSGLLQVLPGGPDLALDLAADQRVDAVSLTGGVAAGRAVAAAAAPKPVLLELGSNAANLVLADADLADAAARIAIAAFGASGQQCISAQRIIVERAVFGPFLELLATAANRLVVGDPTDPSTDIGPLAHAGRRAAVETVITDALERGATLQADGRTDDLCYGPTIITDAPLDALVWREEVFGPVAVLVAADSIQHAISLANDSAFGLQSACFTADLGAAMHVAEELRCGSVWINDSTRFRLDTYPFGGYGRSGVGREGVRYAMEALSHIKFVGLRSAR